jgi:hypothetical protein
VVGIEKVTRGAQASHKGKDYTPDEQTSEAAQEDQVNKSQHSGDDSSHQQK